MFTIAMMTNHDGNEDEDDTKDDYDDYNLAGRLQQFVVTRPKPAYGRQGLQWDRWVRIQFRRVHSGVDTFWENIYFWKKISLIWISLAYQPFLVQKTSRH